MLCCFSGTTYGVITFLICIIQKREYLQSEKRYAKKKNDIFLYSEEPFKEAEVFFYFIGTLSYDRVLKNLWRRGGLMVSALVSESRFVFEP